jgi:hypothetical protein
VFVVFSPFLAASSKKEKNPTFRQIFMEADFFFEQSRRQRRLNFIQLISIVHHEVQSPEVPDFAER